MPLETLSVLVVDDVNAMRVQVKEILKAAGFKKIDLAADGTEAQKCIQQNAYDVVLSDWHMEPMAGIDLLQWVRANPLMNQSVFILVTAENSKENVMKAIELGVDNYVMKPLTAAQVQEKVIPTIQKKRGPS